MITKLLFFLIGYARFVILPESISEKLPQDVLSCGIYDFICENTGLSFKTSYGKAAKIKKLLDAAGISYKLEIHGVLDFLYRLFRNKGILAGLLFCVLLHIYFSGLIFGIHIIGNHTIPDAEIKEKMKTLGVYEGKRISDINTEKFDISFMLADDRFSFAHLNINGNTAELEVNEANEKPKSRYDKIKVGNIVAKCSGVIERADVYSGQPEVSAGDTVEKGTLLVSPFFETRSAGILLRQAKAAVFAKTEVCFEMLIPKEKYCVSDEKAYNKYVLSVLSENIPLYIKDERYPEKTSTFSLTKEKKTPTVFGKIKMPFELITYHCREKTFEKKTVTPEEAKTEFDFSYKKWRNTFEKNAEILSEQTEISENDFYYIMTCRAVCIENIALETQTITG